MNVHTYKSPAHSDTLEAGCQIEAQWLKEIEHYLVDGGKEEHGLCLQECVH